MAGALAFAGVAGAAPDWSKVQPQDIVLFQPGRSSMEWISDHALHSGARSFQGGKSCGQCHGEEAADLGAAVAKNHSLEPQQLPGRPTALTLTVRAAVDANNFYLRAEWADPEWKAPAPTDKDFESKLTVMWDDGAVPGAAQAGCWVFCHDSLSGMPKGAPDARSGDTLFLVDTRAEDGSQRPYADILALLNSGRALELWQLGLNRAQPAVVRQGYVLEKRRLGPATSLQGKAEYRSRRWVADFVRPLKPASGKAMQLNRTYTFGFAVHEGHLSGRLHLVSFETSMSLGVPGGQIVATALK